MKWSRVLFFLCLLIVAPAIARTPLAAGDHLRVRVITMGPGSDPWEKFGHDCIEIVDTETGLDLSYNWGVFSFGEGFSGFVSFGARFLQGRLEYLMMSDPTEAMLERYDAAGRSILVQELNLTPEAKLALRDRLMSLDTDANRYYLYDYFQTNCATKVRDQIDEAADGRVAATLKTVPTGTTYRWHDRRLTPETPWLFLFLDYSLGHPVDRPLSAWQESFLPEKLAEHLRSVRVPDGRGGTRPLVKWERQLRTGQFAVRASSPNPFPVFLSSGLGLGVVIFGLAMLGRYRLARWSFVLLSTGWSAVAGLLGTLITYAWFSDHLAAMWNENWFQWNPLSLLLVVLIPFSRRLPSAAKAMSVAVLAVSLIGLAAKVTPWGSQTNAAMIALALPVHVAIAAGLAKLRAGRDTVPTSATLEPTPATFGRSGESAVTKS